MSDEEKQERADRVRALRKAAGFTSADHAAAKADIDRSMWVKFETAKNAMTTADAQDAVARAVGADRGDVDEYLDGKIELSTLLERIETDRRYPAMAVVRKAAVVDDMVQYLATFSVDLKSNEQPTSAMLLTMFMDHVARERGKAVPERGDALGGIRKPKRK
jgi:transcriptional regulator with XRE-family HTH domain